MPQRGVKQKQQVQHPAALTDSDNECLVCFDVRRTLDSIHSSRHTVDDGGIFDQATPGLDIHKTSDRVDVPRVYAYPLYENMRHFAVTLQTRDRSASDDTATMQLGDDLKEPPNEVAKLHSMTEVSNIAFSNLWFVTRTSSTIKTSRKIMM